MNASLSTIIALAIGLAFAGCQSADPFDRDPDVQRTKLGDGGTFAVKSPDALHGYESVYLKSVTANPSPGMDGTNIEQSDVTALEYAFENAFRATVTPVLPVVPSPGQRTLVAVATIDNVVFAGEPAPLEEDILQQDLANSDDPDGGYDTGLGAPFIFGSNAGVGDITLYMTFADSESGEVLATFQDESFGNRIDTISGMTSWSRIRDAFNAWGGELAGALGPAVAP